MQPDALQKAMAELHGPDDEDARPHACIAHGGEKPSAGGEEKRRMGASCGCSPGRPRPRLASSALKLQRLLALPSPAVPP